MVAVRGRVAKPQDGDPSTLATLLDETFDLVEAPREPDQHAVR
jgi:hypothetical protein